MPLFAAVIAFFAVLDWDANYQQGLDAQKAGQYAEAVEAFGRAAQLTVAFDESDIRAARTWNNLGSVQYLTGRLGPAEESLRKAARLFDVQPQATADEVARVHHNLSAVYRQAARYADAEKEARRSIAESATAAAYHNLAEIQRLQGRFEEARKAIATAKTMPRDSLIESHLLLAEAAILVDQRGPAPTGEIASLQRRAASLLERSYGPRHPHTLSALANLGQTLLASLQTGHPLAEPAEIERQLRSVLESSVATFGPRHARTAAAANNLGQFFGSQGRFAEAEDHLRTAIATWEAALGEHHPDLARGLNNLGALFARQGKMRGAEQLYLRASRIAEQALPEAHPLRRDILRNLADLYRAQKRTVEWRRIDTALAPR